MAFVKIYRRSRRARQRTSFKITPSGFELPSRHEGVLDDITYVSFKNHLGSNRQVTFDCYMADLKTLKGFLENKPLERADPEDLWRYWQWLNEIIMTRTSEEIVVNKERRYSSRTVQRKWMAIKKFYKFLFAVRKSIAVNPVEACSTIHENDIRFGISVDHSIQFNPGLINAMDNIIIKISDDRAAALLYFMVATAVRVTELTELHENDLEPGTDNKGNEIYRINILGKGSKAAAISVDRKVGDAVFKVFGRGNVKLFVDEIGRPYDRDRIYYLISKIFKVYFGEHINPHQTRHYSITKMVEKGVDIKLVSLLARHFSSAFTLDHYVHPEDDLEKRKTYSDKVAERFVK